MTKAASDATALRDAFNQYWRLVKIVRPYWPGLVQGILMGGILGVLGLVMPYMSKLLLDGVYPAANWTLLKLVVVGTLVLTVTRAALGAVRAYYTSYVTAHLTAATSLMLFNHIQHLPARFFDDHRVGDVMSRFGDLRGALGGISQVFATVVIQGLYLLLVPPLLLVMSWKLTLMSLLAMPFVVLTRIATASTTRRYHQRNAEASADVSAYHAEVLTHIRSLKTLATERFVFERAKHLSNHALEIQLRSNWYSQGVGLLVATVTALGVAAYTWYGWSLVLAGQVTLGSLIAFLAYLGLLHTPIAALTGTFTGFQRTAVFLRRVFEYLDQQAEQDPSAAYGPPTPLTRRMKGHIDVDEASVNYAGRGTVFANVTAHFRPGQVTAVVGHSGCGKSSFLRLLAGTLLPAMGAIRIDGRSVSDWPVNDIRRQLTLVPQESPIFKATLIENLTLGVEHWTDHSVAEAVAVCRLEQFISELPSGYRTSVAEWGATLSAGQRQRLALARALLRRSQIILLDEATSSLDPSMEAEIIRELLHLWRDRTVVFVTHRPSVTKLADQIMLLEAGGVAAMGTPEELMTHSLRFRRFASPLGETPMHEPGGANASQSRLATSAVVPPALLDR